MVVENKVIAWADRFKDEPMWSVCEIGLSSDDYHGLLDDLKQVEQKCFLKPPDWLGLALTITLAECGRRYAGEDNFWVPVSRQLSEMPWRDKIFNRAGQPTSKCRKILEDTARHFRLRHVYGNEDTMEWYVSMRLQFGFTRSGFERRLHEWLPSNVMPTPCKLLLGEKKSDSFYKLWKHLWLFRKDRLSERKIRDCLRESPWVLPEWHDALISKALERREYDYVYRTNNGDENDDHWIPRFSEKEAAEEVFLARPRLVWGHNESPHYELSVEEEALDTLDLTDSEYSFWVGGFQAGRFLKQTDGSYRAESPTISVQHPLPSMDVELKNESAMCVVRQRLELWDEDAEVVVFDLTAGGFALIDEGQGIMLKVGNEYAVWTAPDLVIHPTPEESRSFAGGMIARLLAHTDTPIDVCFNDGTVINTLTVTERPLVNLDGVRAELVASEDVFPDELTLTARHRIKVSVPEGVSLKHIRRDGKALSGDWRHNFWWSQPLDLTDAEHASGVRLQLTIEVGGEMRSVSRRVYANVDGAVLWEANPGQVFKRSVQQDRLLHAGKARTTLFLFRVNGDAHSYYVFEGGFCHGRVKTKPAALKSLHGFGAPLTVGFSRFNTHSEEGSCVSRAVIDTGILGEIDAEGIKLLHPLQTNREHRLVVVRPDWSLYSCPAEKNPTGTCLKSDLLTDGWLAVGLFFRGRRLGTIWNQNATLFSSSLANADLQKAIQIITLFKLPFLLPVFKNTMREYLLAHPAEFLAAWSESGDDTMTIDGETFIVSMTAGGDSLRYSVSSLIGTGRLDIADDVCREIITIFGGDVENLTLQDLAILLDDVLDWSPRLAAKIAGVAGNVDTNELCKKILKSPTICAKLEVAKNVGSHPAFIGHLLTTHGASEDRWAGNVARLLHNRMFRRLLTCFLISNPRV